MSNSSTAKTTRVIYSTRVVPHYRVPLLEALSRDPNITLRVVTTRDRKDSKAQNFKGPMNFDVLELWAWRPSVRTRNGAAELSIPFGLGRSLVSFSPDVVITEGASHIFGNITAFIYAKLFRRRIIQWSLGELHNRKLSLPRRLLNAAFFQMIERKSDAAIAYSQMGADYFARIGLPEDKIVVALNTIDTQARIAKHKAYAEAHDLTYPSPRPETFNVVYVGALIDVKRVDLLIEAFAKFSQVIPDGRLSIAGDGPLRPALAQQVSDAGLSDRVMFWGHISDELPRFFHDASVLVMPGLGGLVISDALAHGVPVICNEGDGSEKDIVTDQCGLLLPQMDAGQLADALVTLARDHHKQKDWRLGALEIVQEKLSIEKYSQSVYKAIKAALRG